MDEAEPYRILSFTNDFRLIVIRARNLMSNYLTLIFLFRQDGFSSQLKRSLGRQDEEIYFRLNCRADVGLSY
jgi:hypothetical protein